MYYCLNNLYYFNIQYKKQKHDLNIQHFSHDHDHDLCFLDSDSELGPSDSSLISSSSWRWKL